MQEKLNEIIEKDSNREIPVFKKIRTGFIQELAQKIAKNTNIPVKIAIAGESASGKTSFANHIIKVCESFNRTNLITMISCDNYYKPLKNKINGETLLDYLKRTGHNLDSPDAINLSRFKEEIERLTRGETFKTSRWDFKTSQLIENDEEKKPAKIILAEGLFTLINGVSDIFDVRIYVHRKHKSIKRHWFERALQRFNSEEETEYVWKRVKQGSKQFIRPSKDNADLVINRRASKESREAVIKEIFEVIAGFKHEN